jgi:hypothetical protein
MQLKCIKSFKKVAFTGKRNRILPIFAKAIAFNGKKRHNETKGAKIRFFGQAKRAPSRDGIVWD